MNHNYIYILRDPNSWKQSKQQSIPYSSTYEIGIGEKHIVIRTQDGLFGHGNNSKGQLGLEQEHQEIEHIFPIPIKFGKSKIIKISCGWNHTLALDQFGNVFSSGEGKNGALGYGRGMDSYCFNQIQGISNINFISAGKDHSLALNNIKVYGWGNSLDGQLGIPKQKICYQPLELYIYPSKICFAGSKYSIFVTQKGVYATGLNQYGQLGLGNKIKIKLPKKINTIENNIANVRGSSFYSVFETIEGQFYIAGTGSLGEYLYPTKIKHFRNCQQVLMAEDFGIARTQQNTCFSWDLNKANIPEQNNLLTRCKADSIFIGPKLIVCLMRDGPLRLNFYQDFENISKKKGIRNQLMAKSSIECCSKPNILNYDEECVGAQLALQANDKKQRKQSEACQNRQFHFDETWQSESQKCQPNGGNPHNGFYTNCWSRRQPRFVDENTEPNYLREKMKEDIASPCFRKDYNINRNKDFDQSKMSQHEFEEISNRDKETINQCKTAKNVNLQKSVENRNKKQFEQIVDVDEEFIDLRIKNNNEENLGGIIQQKTIQLVVDQTQVNKQLKQRIQFLENQNKKKDQQIRKLRKELLEFLELAQSDHELKKIIDRRHQMSLFCQNKGILIEPPKETDIFTKSLGQLRVNLGKAINYLEL